MFPLCTRIPCICFFSAAFAGSLSTVFVFASVFPFDFTDGMNALTVFYVGYFAPSLSGLLLCSEQLCAGIYFGLDGNSESEKGDWLKELWHINPFEGASLERQSEWIVILVSMLEMGTVSGISKTLNVE
jgi:hypothetical protein